MKTNSTTENVNGYILTRPRPPTRPSDIVIIDICHKQKHNYIRYQYRCDALWVFLLSSYHFGFDYKLVYSILWIASLVWSFLNALSDIIQWSDYSLNFKFFSNHVRGMYM